MSGFIQAYLIKLPIAGGNGNSISKYVGFMLIGLSIILYAVLIIRNKNLIKKINYS